jgi:hypothetical protein
MRFSAITSAAVAMLASASAKAAFVLTLSSGASTVVVNDNGVGVTVGDFSASFTVGTSNSPGSPTQGLLQIQTLTVRNNAASTATLNLWLADTSFTAPGGPGSTLELKSAIGGTLLNSASGTNGVVFQSFADPANGDPFVSSYTAGPQVYASAGGPLVSFNSTVTSSFPFAGPAYSLGNLTNITLDGGAQANISGTTTTSVVPEPAAAGLLVGGLGLIARRRRA